MTETSFYWDGLAVGDATLAPYSPLLFHQLWRKLLTGSRANDGYVENYLDELVVAGVSGGVTVASGAALVAGGFYESTGQETFALTTPGGSTRIDRVVLRRHWGTKETRLTIISGSEGGGAPSLLQVEGSVWDTPIAQMSITTAGVITVADQRNRVRTTLAGSAVLQHIETVEADGTELTMDFSDIPQTFRHLIIDGQLRSKTSSVNVVIGIMLNGNTGSISNRQVLFVNQSDQNDKAFAEIDSNNLGNILVAGGAAGAGRNGLFSLRIPFYANEHFYKNVQQNDGVIYNDTLNEFVVTTETDVWKVVEAINRVTIVATTSDNFAIGSRVSLYGME